MDVIQEVWKGSIVGGYSISNLGRVRNDKTGCVLKPYNFDGYLRVSLKNNTLKVHRLVAFAFLEKTSDKNIVNHKNGIKTDNRVENLEWCTELENRQHAVAHGLSPAGVDGKKIINHKTGKKYESIREAARQTGQRERHISDCLHGRRPSAGWDFA